MSGYIKQSLSKRRQAEARTDDVLTGGRRERSGAELAHGEWIAGARARLERRRFRHPLFALVLVFGALFIGSVYLFESLTVAVGTPVYGLKIAMSSLFAVSLGFIMSVWWQATARYDTRLREAERIDREYRELLISFSDSLFDIINALNTLATKPPKPFVVASEFLLGEYIHLLQSQLQRYGDYIAGLGFDATAFLDEKIRIFEGIRERASLSIQGMPKEIESLFVETLSLHEPTLDAAALRQKQMRAKLQELDAAVEEPAPTEQHEPALTP